MWKYQHSPKHKMLGYITRYTEAFPSPDSLPETCVRTQVHLLSTKLATPRLWIMLKILCPCFSKFFQNVYCTEIQMTACYHEANGQKEKFHHYTKPYCTMWTQHEWIWINLFCYFVQMFLLTQTRAFHTAQLAFNCFTYFTTDK